MPVSDDERSGRVPRLHVLASAGEIERPHGPATLRRLLRRPHPIAVHVRARLPARRIYELSADLAGAARESGSWCVVNGRPDIALAAGAQGVQLGGAALGVREVRAMVAGSSLRVGASVHDPEEARERATEGVDYLVVGTVYETESHPGRKGRGPGWIRRVHESLAGGDRPPLLAIGGVTLDRIPELARAGAYGVVVHRAVWESADPVEAADRLAAALEREGETATGEGDEENRDTRER